MKKNLLFLTFLISTVAFGQTTNYPGNENSSFGGAVGQGSLAITETDTTVSFSLTRGPGPFDSLIVFYIDVQDGGISTTSVLEGSASDPYRAAAAGHNPLTGRAVLNFPNDFLPDAAVVFDKDSGRLYAFATIPFLGTSIIVRDSFLVDSVQNVYTGSSSKERLGITGPLNIKFVGTYIGRSASRSNEAFGDPFVNYARPAGMLSYNPYTITSYFTYTSTLLPVRLVDFKAAKEDDIVNISWLADNEINIEKYEVQRSTDGVTFTTIASVKSRNSALSSSYNIKDLSAQNGINYYRLIITEIGRSEISKIVSLNLKRNRSNFVVSVISSNTLNEGCRNLSKCSNTINTKPYKRDLPGGFIIKKC
jgi:hypothetical protein